MASDSRPRFQQEQFSLTGWLREPDIKPMPAGMEPRRLNVYRELFFNNVTGFLENSFPVLQSLLPDALWQRLTQGFFADHRCHTPYFHEIAEEFMAYFNGLDWPELAAYPWARELVHFEWVELAADIAEAGEMASVNATGDPLEGIPVLSSLAWPLVYHWPVHRFAEERGVPEQPPSQPTCVLVYRDQNDDVQMMDITPLTAHLLESLRANVGDTGRDLLLRIAAEAGYADTSAFVAAGAGILAELQQSGIIPGTRL